MTDFEPAQYDPSRNVLALVDASIKRLEDMMGIHVQRLDDKFRDHVTFASAIAEAESERITAVREMDVKTYATAIQKSDDDRALLSSRVSSINEGLRALIAATQDVLTKQSEQRVEQLGDRITLLERSQYQTQGKDQVSRSVIGVISGILGAILGMVFKHFFLEK
jgi:hypothetical protein